MVSQGWILSGSKRSCEIVNNIINKMQAILSQEKPGWKTPWRFSAHLQTLPQQNLTSESSANENWQIPSAMWSVTIPMYSKRTLKPKKKNGPTEGDPLSPEYQIAWSQLRGSVGIRVPETRTKLARAGSRKHRKKNMSDHSGKNKSIYQIHHDYLGYLSSGDVTQKPFTYAIVPNHNNCNFVLLDDLPTHTSLRIRRKCAKHRL